MYLLLEIELFNQFFEQITMYGYYLTFSSPLDKNSIYFVSSPFKVNMT